PLRFMKILVDGRPLVDPKPGGVPRVSRALVRSLMAAMPEHQFSLLTTGASQPVFPFALPQHATHEHIYIPNKLWSAATWLNAWSLDGWSRMKPDVLFFPNLGDIGRPQIPYALLIHDLSFLIEPRWFSWKARLWHKRVHAKRLIRGAKFLFAASEKTKEDLQEHLKIDAKKIIPLPFGLDPEISPAPIPDPIGRDRFFLVLGMDDRRKNTECVLSAFRALCRKNPSAPLRLVVVGGRKKIAPEPRLSVLSHPSDNALAGLFAQATAFLYPSWYEGFGIPLHEAARFGTPCIASSAGCLPETAPKGTLFASPAKPHHWMQAMELILHAPDSYKTQTRLQDWTAAAHLLRDRLFSITQR
ncbi:MAG TPA: glycosyltransferase family 1 protein, partial [Patescibacteria group bacterium]|nr:glycosyltransferase family 1 protein [Patescibacteria group bacterium]